MDGLELAVAASVDRSFALIKHILHRVQPIEGHLPQFVIVDGNHWTCQLLVKVLHVAPLQRNLDNSLMVFKTFEGCTVLHIVPLVVKVKDLEFAVDRITRLFVSEHH